MNVYPCPSCDRRVSAGVKQRHVSCPNCGAEFSIEGVTPIDTEVPDTSWFQGCSDVLLLVLEERERQVANYGHNRNIENGTGPHVRYLERTTINLDLRTATEIEAAVRRRYERMGKPTWLRLVLEEVTEAFKEDDPQRLESELIQVAALCVSWVEKLREQKD